MCARLMALAGLLWPPFTCLLSTITQVHIPAMSNPKVRPRLRGASIMPLPRPPLAVFMHQTLSLLHPCRAGLLRCEWVRR